MIGLTLLATNEGKSSKEVPVLVNVKNVACIFPQTRTDMTVIQFIGSEDNYIVVKQSLNDVYKMIISEGRLLGGTEHDFSKY